jgi:hypothetical protein
VRQSVRHLAFGPNHEAIATRRSDRSPGGIGSRSSVELSHEIVHDNVNPRAGGRAVTHRQRPATAQGVTFINLEGSPGVWARHRRLAQTASALLIRGQVQNATGAVTVVADRLGRVDLAVGSRSRDFRRIQPRVGTRANSQTIALQRDCAL